MENKLQNVAMDIAISGHNMLLTGAGRSGKTYIIKQIIKELKMKNKTVHVTVSTGMASTCFKEFEGTTLHKWCGMKGTCTNETHSDIVEMIREQGNYENVISADVLIVDEVGMVSVKLFETVEYICRELRENGRYFGGLQIILCGSFTQLPPVPNKISNDPGEYCFQSDIFQKAIGQHHVHLVDMIRQKDFELGKIVKELEIGEPSDESEQLIRSLERSLDDDASANATVLLGTNLAVDMHNQERLHELSGEFKYYRSEDEGLYTT